ncbi:hypothetical protein PspLS_05804 [Pyricularia sp. CBS 133598]|nr:hypothetical protein PspLS_05804 [Pyricularia sp. CBS 133598]
MNHQVPNEGITVEASRPAWPRGNPDCMHALRWRMLREFLRFEVPELPNAAGGVLFLPIKSLSRPPPPSVWPRLSACASDFFFWKWAAQGDPCHRFRPTPNLPDTPTCPTTITTCTYLRSSSLVLDWASKNSARLKAPQFIPHELDLTHSSRMGIIISISSLGTLLYLQYSHFCIACNVLRSKSYRNLDELVGVGGGLGCVWMGYVAKCYGIHPHRKTPAWQPSSICLPHGAPR